MLTGLLKRFATANPSKSLLASSALAKQHFSYLVANIPPTLVYVRKEYLTKFEEGHGELEEGVWATVKSKKDRAFLFETLFTDYGALYDKLPISAFLWKPNVDFSKLLPLDYLQLWNCMGHNIAVIKKANIDSLRCEVLMKDGKYYPGQYYFTIDQSASDPTTLSLDWSDIPCEHKSFNIIKLDNGQFAAQPNNRIKWKQASLIPNQTKNASFFKVCEIDYQVEDTPKWSVGETSSYFYKSAEEESAEANKDGKSESTTAAEGESTATHTSGEKKLVRITGEDAVNHIGGISKPYWAITYQNIFKPPPHLLSQ